MALTGLKLAERDASRGVLDSEQAGEDRRHGEGDARQSRRLRAAPLVRQASAEAREDNGKDKDGSERPCHARRRRGAAKATTALPVVERAELAPGWVVDEPIFCIGGRNRRSTRRLPTMLAEVLKKRGLGAKALPPEAISAGAYRLARQDRGQARLPVLSRSRQRSRADPLSGAALAAHPAQGTPSWSAFGPRRATRPPSRPMLETAEADAYATVIA